jgi:diguanylate cyclase (GGDEF) domain
MEAAKKILIVDDSQFNRTNLRKMLSDSYQVIETKNGQEAMNVLELGKDFISAIVLDIVMPVMDGYKVLELVKGNKKFEAIPVIVINGDCDSKSELKALKLGANDFLRKPFEAAIIKQRLKNIIQLSETIYLTKVVERDKLTGIYNKATFYEKVHELLVKNTDVTYDLICIDIERFKVINDLFGVAEGDKLLHFIAEKLSSYPVVQAGIFGRLDSDHFAICTPRKDDYEECLVENAEKMVAAYPLDVKIFLCFGVYLIYDHNQPVNIMCDRGILAACSIKGNYAKRFAYYEDTYLTSLLKEQEILDDTQAAFSENQFEVFLQPKCDLNDGSINGFEALARWNHPKKGYVSPTEFIPIFEHNGCIQKLDFYIWDKTCKIIRSWIDNGKTPMPVSVNVSRMDFYNPQVCQLILGLTKTHNIDPSLLELEITETAYTDNPNQLFSVIAKLQEYGFTILMDDFGSGYSSLNMLKDIPVDVLKIDLNFLTGQGNAGRGANILLSIVRMARWLKLQVIVEGVETKDQADFLRSIGCESAQGYYFYKPMNIDSVEKLYDAVPKHYKEETIEANNINIEMLLDKNNQFSSFFSSIVGCVGIFELFGDNLEIIRVNDNYFELMGISMNRENVLSSLVPEDIEGALSVLHRCEKSKKVQICQLRHKKPNGQIIWISARVFCLTSEGFRSLFYIVINDINEIKSLEQNYYEQLQKYKKISGTLKEKFFYYDVNSDVLSFLDNSINNTVKRFSKEFRKNIMSMEFIHEDYKELFGKCFEDAINEVSHGVLEFKASIAGGEYQWCRMSYSSIADKDGRVTSIVGQMQNIEDLSV